MRGAARCIVAVKDAIGVATLDVDVCEVAGWHIAEGWPAGWRGQWYAEA